MSTKINAKQRVDWINERVNLTEQQKEYVEFQIKMAITEAQSTVKNNDVLPIVTNRFFKGLGLNIAYYLGVCGMFFSWAVEGKVTDWVWWVKLLIFAIIVNVHKDVSDYIRKYGW